MYSVTWIVGNMHVGTSYTAVVKEFYRRLRSNAGWTGPNHKPGRKMVYRLALKAHRANRQLVADFRL